jgi:hypothetical protein
MVCRRTDNRAAGVLPPRVSACGGAVLLLLALSNSASAHCFVGNRFFPATVGVDDPCVADELSLPTVAGFKNGDNPSADELDIAGEYSKTITPNFGISLGWNGQQHDRRRAVHHADANAVPRQGSRLHAVALAEAVRDHGTGRLCDPDQELDERAGRRDGADRHDAQSTLRGLGRHAAIQHALPQIERAGFRPSGFIYVADKFQLAAEAIIPINRASGDDIGVVGQLHFYLDDIFPRSLGRPLFGGNSTEHYHE